LIDAIPTKADKEKLLRFCSKNDDKFSTKEVENESLVMRGGDIAQAQAADDDAWRNAEVKVPRQGPMAQETKVHIEFQAKLLGMNRVQNAKAYLKTTAGKRLLGFMSSPPTFFYDHRYMTKTGLQELGQSQCMHVCHTLIIGVY
jgi:hypothetical protein